MDSPPVIDDLNLCAEALAADPDSLVPGDAIPFAELTRTTVSGALPEWYMPAPMGPPALGGWRRLVVRLSSAMLILSFLTITAAGLCNTYGDLHL